jgi:hypothetical protein
MAPSCRDLIRPASGVITCHGLHGRRRVTAHCAGLSHARGGGPAALRIRRVTALRDCGARPGPEWASSVFPVRAAGPDAGPRAGAGRSATMLSVNVHLQVLSHNGRVLFPDARPAFENCRSALAGNGGTEVELDRACNVTRASGLRLAARWKSRYSNTGGNCVAMAGPTRRERRQSCSSRIPDGPAFLRGARDRGAGQPTRSGRLPAGHAAAAEPAGSPVGASDDNLADCCRSLRATGITVGPAMGALAPTSLLASRPISGALAGRHRSRSVTGFQAAPEPHPTRDRQFGAVPDGQAWAMPGSQISQIWICSVDLLGNSGRVTEWPGRADGCLGRAFE